jgi:hypothetical protein
MLVLEAARAYAPLMQDVSRFIAFTRALGAVVTTEAQGATGDKAALLHTIALLMRGLQRGN